MIIIIIGVFIVNFEHISHLFLMLLFEQVNVSWVHKINSNVSQN